jgi:type I restriction enzyme, S subunit
MNSIDQHGWTRKPLGEVANVVSGYAFKSSEFGQNGIPAIKIKNVRVGYVDLTDADRVHEKFLSIPERYHVTAGDVLISLTGSHISQPNSVVGRVARHSAGLPTCLLNQRVGKVIVKQHTSCDLGFLFYALSQQETVRAIALKAHGVANQANVSPTQVESIEIPLPPLLVQRRIAGILSAYDELIENSQRRIRVLEAMARALYRGWFVHFLFSGHEKIPRVASPRGGIPRGWEATTLGTQLSALESGKRPKGGIRGVEDGVASIGAENINGIGRHDFDGEKFVPREFFEEMRKGVVCDRDVAIYKDGAYIGKSSYFRDGFPHAKCCVNEHVFLLRSNGVRLKQNALYLWLQEPDTVLAIRATNANAAQPGINQQSVGGLKLVVPDEKTAKHFDRLVEPLLAELINLAKRIQNLRRTRDLLLPRLLSGQIDVEGA